MAFVKMIPDWLIALPFAVSLFVFGMPHGAADGAVAWWWAQRRGYPRWSWLGFVAIYTLVIVLTILYLVARPAFVLAVFLLVSVLHFGLAAARLYRSHNRISGVLTAAVIVLLPFATQPDATQKVFSDIAALFGQPGFSQLSIDFFGVTGVAAAAALLGLSIKWVITARDETRASAMRLLALLFLISLTHVLLPPLMGVGIWFLLWHAIPELLCVARCSQPNFSVLRAIVHGHLLSAPLLVPTVAALVFMVGADASYNTLRDIALCVIAAYAVVTPGHFAFQEAIAAKTIKSVRRDTKAGPSVWSPMEAYQVKQMRRRSPLDVVFDEKAQSNSVSNTGESTV